MPSAPPDGAVADPDVLGAGPVPTHPAPDPMSSSDDGSLSAGQIEAQMERLCGTDRPPTEPSSPRTWRPHLDSDAAHVP
eukprot:4281107-Alexandrium_andersonii.AAC.1